MSSSVFSEELSSNSFNIFKLLSGPSFLVNKLNIYLLLILYSLYIFYVVNLLISKKVVIINLLTDVVTLELRKPYHTGLNEKKKNCFPLTKLKY